MFNILINIHEYANETFIIYAHDINIFSLYCITGAVAKCDNDNLGLKLVYSWIYKHFKSLLMFLLKFMNMKIS